MDIISEIIKSTHCVFHDDTYSLLLFCFYISEEILNEPGIQTLINDVACQLVTLMEIKKNLLE